MVERHFPRRFDALDAIFAFVEEFLASETLDPQHAFDVNLVVEELFTNMVKYARDGVHDIAMALSRDPRGIVITLRDFDVERFDVTKAPEVDVSRPLAERRVGGLGIHFVRQVADRIQYDYRDRTSTITVWKRL
jgi:anti-sigma regulatory factor (Ser/Thr protein kinase)